MEPHQRTLGDRGGRFRAGFDDRPNYLGAPRRGVLDVEDGVQVEVVPHLRGDAETPQPEADFRGTTRRRLLDDTQRAQRVIGITPVQGEASHQVAERGRLPHIGVAKRGDVERRRERVQHGNMHALGIAAPHLIPIVTGDFQLRTCRQADLGDRGEVFEPGLAGYFLCEEPAHLVESGSLGKVVEQRVALAGSTGFQIFDPREKGIGISRCGGRPRRLAGPLFLQPIALDDQHARVHGQPGAPVRGGQGRRQTAGVKACQRTMKRYRVLVRRRRRMVLHPRRTARHFHVHGFT